MKKYIWILTVLIMGLGYFVIAKLFGVTIPCLFYEITGWYCPGCGITRAFMALTQLQIYQAFRYNSLVFIIIPSLIVEWQFRKLGKKKISEIIVITLLIITIGYGILRNFEVFYFLAPTLCH